MTSSGRDAGRAWQLLMRFFLAQRGEAPTRQPAHSLSPVQCHVLHLIEPGTPIPMSRLAEALSCDASNVTGLIDRLEARGLVQRRPAAGDRRVKVLDLTPVGVRIRDQLLSRTRHRSHPLSRLSADEQRTLIRLLEKLLEDPPA
jgi:DNA-binding MarR family transcriptional regulator